MLNWIVWKRTGYLYKNEFGLNNLKRLIFHKTHTKQLKLSEVGKFQDHSTKDMWQFVDKSKLHILGISKILLWKSTPLLKT